MIHEWEEKKVVNIYNYLQCSTKIGPSLALNFDYATIRYRLILNIAANLLV